MSVNFYSHPVGIICQKEETFQVFNTDSQTWRVISPEVFALLETDCTSISRESANKAIQTATMISKTVIIRDLVAYKPPVKAIVPFRPVPVAAARAPLLGVLWALRFIRSAV